MMSSRFSVVGITGVFLRRKVEIIDLTLPRKFWKGKKTGWYQA
ncbi:hypothetical protein [uncultured Desulfovibrio sp.]|nr:hypothetical protein [uncultured Desulfovibrio sp.]